MKVPNSTVNNDLALARECSRSACDVLRHYFKKVKHVSAKAGAGLVSEADQEAERAIREILRKEDPGTSILGEEEGLEGSRGAERLWVVDPLDGTHNYLAGLPVFCVSIGLLVKGQPKVGVISAPELSQEFWASQGQGAFLDGAPLDIRGSHDPEQTLFATGFSYSREKKSLEEQLSLIAEMFGHCLGVRRFGAAAWDLAMTANGSFGAFWEAGLSPWDMAAGICIVREAGGRVTDFSGQEHDVFTQNIIASAPAYFDRVFQVIHMSKSQLVTDRAESK